MKPRIFISSTFYDLKFIREDISSFVKAHDFEPIMFEDGDIGYTPGKELDKSCYETMKNADMVLLIIGGEYGSAATGENIDNFKEYISVTRNEFRAAVDAGIPMFVFVDSNVYTEYGIYEINCDAIENKKIEIEFKATKSVNVFRFIKEIRSLCDKPIQEFRRSTEIKSFLGKQWSDMFKNYLIILKENKENTIIRNSVADINVLIEKMNIMLDAVGKKIIGDNDIKQYDDIIAKQNDLEAERLCKMIANGITIKINEEQNIDNNVEALINAFKDLNVYGQEEKDDLELKDTDFFLKFENNLEKYNLGAIAAKYRFIISIENITAALHNSEIENAVKEKIKSSKYYEQIFVFEDHTNQTKYENQISRRKELLKKRVSKV